MTSTDKSMLMNALAQKYLPIEASQSNSSRSPIHNGVTQSKMASDATISPQQNNFNFQREQFNSDSYRYLEKYGLL